jgi:hypothetical protein
LPILGLMVPCRLRIVVYPETSRSWTARGLEHDLAAEGRSVEAAIDAVMKIALAHIAYDRRHDREPLSAFMAAPRLYWAAFHSGTPLPVTMEVPWSAHGATGKIVTAIVQHHPAVRPFSGYARSA